MMKSLLLAFALCAIAAHAAPVNFPAADKCNIATGLACAAKVEPCITQCKKGIKDCVACLGGDYATCCPCIEKLDPKIIHCSNATDEKETTAPQACIKDGQFLGTNFPTSGDYCEVRYSDPNGHDTRCCSHNCYHSATSSSQPFWQSYTCGVCHKPSCVKPSAPASATKESPAVPECFHQEDLEDHKCFEACNAEGKKFATKGIDTPNGCPGKYNTVDSTKTVLQCPDGVTNVRYCAATALNVTIATKGEAGAIFLGVKDDAPVCTTTPKNPKGCNVCAACCKTYLKDDTACAACAKKECKPKPPDCLPKGHFCGSNFKCCDDCCYQPGHCVGVFPYGTECGGPK